MNTTGDQYCGENAPTKNGPWTYVIEAFGICLFLMTIGLTITNMYKYLWVGRRYVAYSITLFYVLILGMLLSRVVQLFLLCFYFFYQPWVFRFGDASLVFDMFIGIVHCNNLCRLIVMLRKLKEYKLDTKVPGYLCHSD